MILLDFEMPILLGAGTVTWAEGAQQALTESSEGDERWYDEHKLCEGLRMAF